MHGPHSGSLHTGPFHAAIAVLFLSACTQGVPTCAESLTVGPRPGPYVPQRGRVERRGGRDRARATRMLPRRSARRTTHRLSGSLEPQPRPQRLSRSQRAPYDAAHERAQKVVIEDRSPVTHDGRRMQGSATVVGVTAVVEIALFAPSTHVRASRAKTVPALNLVVPHPAGNPQGQPNPATRTGAKPGSVSVVPLPSWPYWLSPQHTSAPSAYSAQLWLLPVASCVTGRSSSAAGTGSSCIRRSLRPDHSRVRRTGCCPSTGRCPSPRWRRCDRTRPAR